MKYIVKEMNITTQAVLTTHEFDSEDAAFEFAFVMNEAMEATPIRYKLCD